MESTLSFIPEREATIDLNRRRRPLLKWAIIVGFWTFFGTLNGAQLVLSVRMEGMHLSFWRLFFTDFLGWVVWMPATVIVLALARRYPVERGSWWRVLPIHLISCLVI